MLISHQLVDILNINYKDSNTMPIQDTADANRHTQITTLTEV